MQVNSNYNQTNFGISHISVNPVSKKFATMVKGSTNDIMAIGNHESLCRIFEPANGQVEVTVFSKGEGDSTISGQVKGLARTKKALLKLVEAANNKMNQVFFDNYHARITIQPERDHMGRPKLVVMNGGNR